MKLLRLLPVLFCAMFFGACEAEVETPGRVEVESDTPDVEVESPDIEVEDNTPDIEVDPD